MDPEHRRWLDQARKKRGLPDYKAPDLGWTPPRMVACEVCGRKVDATKSGAAVHTGCAYGRSNRRDAA